MINVSMKADLRKTFREFADAYTKAVQDSYNKQLMNLKPGDPAPVKKIAKMDERKAFEALSRTYMSKAEKILTSARDQLRAEIAKAPTPEAVNFITLLAARTGNITQEEIDAAVKAYGSNYQAYKAIADIARAHKIHLPAPSLDEDLEYIKAQLRSLPHEYSLSNAEAGGTSSARIAFAELMEG